MFWTGTWNVVLELMLMGVLDLYIHGGFEIDNTDCFELL